jgi:O-antigen/teichoic acid export membrane protein
LKTQLYQWLKTNRVMLINAGSLVSTTLVTGVLGFAYWWVAARQFHPNAVGLASASVSAMMLLGAICVLGLGTLLIGELPRQPGKEASLISTALLLVGLVGGFAGILFALLAPFVSADFLPLRATIESILIFAAGVSLTSITIVLDQALIGLLRGELQFWRNTLFAAAKLAALLAIALALHSSLFSGGGVAIYATWTIGNTASLLPLAIFALFKKRSSLKHIMPDWSLLRKLGLSALQHHMLNLIQQVPTTLLPVLVTVILSATTNAWFYMAWMISGFVFTASYALTTVLYAINTAPPEEIARKIRMTLNLAFVTSLGANIVIQIGATQILSLFGHTYAEQAAWSLRIVSLAAFPMIIKFHYIAVSRINKKLLNAMLPVAIGSLIELGAAALGAHLGDLVGLSLGWAIAIAIEAVFMAPAVFKAVRFRPSIETQENLSLVDIVSLQTQLASTISSPPLKQETLHPSTSNTQKSAEEAVQLRVLLPDDEMEKTELLPSTFLPAFYKTRTQPLATLPGELEMQKFLSISTSITGKHKAVKLPSTTNTTPIVDKPVVDKLTQLQQLPKLPASIADALIETQRLPKKPVSVDTSQEKTQILADISSPSPMLCCVPCHASLPEKVSFCSNCGTKLDTRKITPNDHIAAKASNVATDTKEISSSSTFCAQCNKALPEYAKFCGNCGKTVTKIATDTYPIQEVQPIIIEEIDENTFINDAEADAETLVAPTEQAPALEEALVATKRGSVAAMLGALLTVMLPIGSLVLWYISLSGINLRNMTDLGLVSVLPPMTIIPLFLLTTSFCLAMWQKKSSIPIILLHVFILLFMLYGITALIESVPRFDVVYRHAGYTEYILRNGGVAAGLDAYFDWAGFFIFSAFLTKIAGYSTILSYAVWSPFFLNLIYFFPLYVIFTTATSDKRIIWFSIWFFYLTNWIGQDYFSPQGLNFFLYLVLIAILLKWFKISAREQAATLGTCWRRLGRLFPLAQSIYGWLTAPDTSITSANKPQRVALLISLIAIFGLMVFSHPLTPFLTIASVTTLIIFRRCKPFWLPALMIIMTTVWIVTMAQPYLVGNLNNIIGDFSHINNVVTQNVTSRTLTGNKDHNFISDIRLFMTAFIWGLAFIGGLLRLRKGHRDITYVLLAIAPFPVLLVQSYGGEMLLRIYLFTLPMMTFFVAAIFFTYSPRKASEWWLKAATLLMCFLLLGAFFFTRYGNEHMDYMTPKELAGVQYLYSVAPANSLFLEAWDGTPWEYKDFELYNTDSLAEDIPNAVIEGNVNTIIQHINVLDDNAPKAYIIITRSQRATADSDGLAPGTLDHLERELLRSKRFIQLYSNRDAQVFVFVNLSANSNH